MTYRILCLHGIGTNSEVFEAQTAALRYHLGPDYDFEFVEGEHPWPAAPGIEALFGRHSLYYSYYDGSLESAIETVDALAEYVSENGPYHAIMGFSLGAAIAATLLLRQHQNRVGQGAQLDSCEDKCAFKCGIFICGLLPLNQHFSTPNFRQCRNSDTDIGMIDIPTVHAWSPNDECYGQQSSKLRLICDPSSRQEVMHGAGHSVPTHGQDLPLLVSAIRGAMTGSKKGTKL